MSKRRYQSVHGANDSGAMRSSLGLVWATDFTPTRRGTSRRTEAEEVDTAKRRAAIGPTIRRSLTVEAEMTAQSKRERVEGRTQWGLTEAELMTGYQQEVAKP